MRWMSRLILRPVSGQCSALGLSSRLCVSLVLSLVPRHGLCLLFNVPLKPLTVVISRSFFPSTDLEGSGDKLGRSPRLSLACRRGAMAHIRHLGRGERGSWVPGARDLYDTGGHWLRGPGEHPISHIES